MIVDGYSTGRYLSSSFASTGIPSIHVASTRDVPAYFASKFDPCAYQACLISDSSSFQQDLIRLTSNREVLAILAGVDSGIELRDRLTELLLGQEGASATSRYRRNKYWMGKRLSDAGLRHIRQERFRTPEDIISWAAANHIAPVVVKPLESAGSDGFSICYHDEQIRLEATNILSNPNVFGVKNEQVLAQEYIDGEEYIINSVFRDGRHYVVDAWHCTKSILENRKVYDLEELIPISSEVVTSTLEPYLQRVLMALGVRTGPAHSELLLDAHGPVLIETGARLQGSIDVAVVEECTGWSHVSATTRAALGSSDFDALAQAAAVGLRKRCFCLGLISRSAGRIIDIPGIEIVKSLPSFRSINLNYTVGDHLPVTRTLLDCPGIIYLASECLETLNNDYTTVRRVENGGRFFVLDSSSEH